MLWPTLATIAGLTILLSLGFWQIRRLNYKTSQIVLMTERVHRAAEPIGPVLTAALGPQGVGAPDISYSHVLATGRFRHDLERFVYAPGDGDWGYHVFTPIELVDGRSIIVNRGYVPRQLKSPSTRLAGMPAGEVTVTGLMRLPAGPRPWYIPAASRKELTWSWPELEDITKSMYGDTPPVSAAVYMDADAMPGPAPPLGGVTRLELPNRHLEYALTWFALAATLAAFYVVSLLRHLRSQRG